MKIIIIGSGNVATHLGLALKAARHKIVQVYSRSESSAKTLGKKLSAGYTTDVKNISSEAEIYILAVSDHAIKDVLHEIRNEKSEIRNSIMLHTSGSVSSGVFEKTIKNYGVLYPVQTFSVKHPVNFKNIPVCIEANNALAQKKITALAKTITKKIHYINSDQRKKIHLAAVFANNFSNHLFAIAEHILKRENISFDLVRPLILETAMKVQNGSPLQMQTGPAKRGDAGVIEEHLKMLGNKKALREIYKLISENIEEMSAMRL
jgi:predicted short-subunit dehydrogenase-like oxidoreductase (DUF2520 family)